MPSSAKVYIAADHAGFALKNVLIERLRALGCEVEDMGAYAYDHDDDYPDYVMPCAHKVAKENPKVGAVRTFGVVIGGSGQGEVMSANRVPGVRAAIFYGPMRASAALDIEGKPSEDGYDIVRLARRHNNANMLSLSGRFVNEEDAEEAVRVFISTPFSEASRHARRLAKF